MSLEFDYGRVFEADWLKLDVEMDGRLVSANVLAVKLRASRAAFLKAHPTTRQEALFDGLEGAFRFWGGVPETGRFDNPRTVAKFSGKGGREESERFAQSRATAAGLAIQLVEARANHALSRIEKLWRKLDLVVLDELGYVTVSREAAQLLFAMISARYELASFVVTSNLDFSWCTEVFGDEGMTAVLIDRLVHRSRLFTTTGDSHRFKEGFRRSRESSA